MGANPPKIKNINESNRIVPPKLTFRQLEKMPEIHPADNKVSPRRIYPFLLVFLLSIVAAGFLDTQLPNGFMSPLKETASSPQLPTLWVGIDYRQETSIAEYQNLFNDWSNSGVQGIILSRDSTSATQDLAQAAKQSGLAIIYCDLYLATLSPSDYAKILSQCLPDDFGGNCHNIGGQNPEQLEAGLINAFEKGLGATLVLREGDLTPSHLAVVSTYFKK